MLKTQNEDQKKKKKNENKQKKKKEQKRTKQNHKKKDDQHGPHKKLRVNQGALEGLAVLSSYKTLTVF